jgi:hypothetical protein
VLNFFFFFYVVLNFCLYVVVVFFFLIYYYYFKLTDYDLIFNDFFFKVQVNINLGPNIFYFSIWAL